ncbi:MAG: cytochrome ubiquinol oxidase subunit I [Candidatus Thermoplasmatota archaeon]|jgi:cytochrome d ubiquinol oxidase subunit I|nr:cytochrome ubiquinol oxidase subunit I [Candidatus Thermoplasmatota archaeon]
MVSIVDFDRFLMGYTLGAHILIVTLSISLAVLISTAEFLGIRRKDRYYEAIARRFSKALVVFFAVGTASGTVLAVELFTLWPSFMVLIGKVDILPFYYEVFAFFLEAIALVLYVYYWEYFKNRYHHWLLSLLVAIGTVMSAVFITLINAFMNTPSGFNIPEYLKTGNITGVNPIAAFMSPSGFVEVAHVTTATFAAGAFLFLAYLAYSYLKNHDSQARILYSKAMKITIVSGFIGLALAGISGDSAARTLISLQPLKYAAIELNLHPAVNAAERLGGIIVNGVPAYYISIPRLQSFLAFLSFNSKQAVPGLSQFPKADWPPLFIHLTFDTMVGGGSLVGLFGLYLLYRMIIKKNYLNWLSLYGMIVAGVLIEVVYDSGWVTDEVGRQPWIIYNVMSVASAANTSPSVIPLGIGIIIFYLIVVPFTFYFAHRLLQHSSIGEELSAGVKKEDVSPS